MKTLHIDDKVHEMFKKFCKNKGYQINKLTEIVIIEYLKNNSQNDTDKKSWNYLEFRKYVTLF